MVSEEHVPLSFVRLPIIKCVFEEHIPSSFVWLPAIIKINVVSLQSMFLRSLCGCL